MFLSCFEIGSHYVTLADLEYYVDTVGLNSREMHPPLPPEGGIKVMCHPTWRTVRFSW